MTKFLAVVKREYVQRVRSKIFVLVTILAPIIMISFGLAPALIFSIKVGGPVRIVVVDQTGKVFDSLNVAFANNDDELRRAISSNENRSINALERASQLPDTDQRFELEQVRQNGRTLAELRRDLDSRINSGNINGYLILPPDLLDDGQPQFFGRKSGDFFTTGELQRTLSRVVREWRLADANIDSHTIQQLSRPVHLEAIRIGDRGDEKDSGGGFTLILGSAFLMYLSILMYGQVVLGAVIEEKETRIAEVLFSSVRPFTLMIGKLVGVALVALTQLSIWAIGLGLLTVFGINAVNARGIPAKLPNVRGIYLVYFVVFFLLGYFLYSTIYALVGSMVTSAQEGGQLAMPILLLLLIGFTLFVPVSKSPDSSFAFWISMVPFFSPLTMLVRIVTQTPPFWQIALSFLIGVAAIVGVTWIAGRIYRVGMLMQGKRASIPEVWRWVRQS